MKEHLRIKRMKGELNDNNGLIIASTDFVCLLFQGLKTFFLHYKIVQKFVFIKKFFFISLTAFLIISKYCDEWHLKREQLIKIFSEFNLCYRAQHYRNAKPQQQQHKASDLNQKP